MESGNRFFGCNGDGNSNMLVFGSADEYFRDNMEEGSKRRHFLSSLDDMLEEEFCGQSPEKKRRLSLQQAHMLEMSFEEENKLEPERKTELAKNLGLQPRQVAVWFQNRRARWKTKNLQRDYDRLKSSYDALLSDFDSILKDNENLKSQVASLTETLSATGQRSDASPVEVPPPSTDGNTEDRFHMGSGGSAVVNELDGPRFVDGGDSYFPDYDYSGGYVAPVDQSEDDGGSDDGRSYFPGLFAAAAEQRELVEEETMGWWVWS